MKLYNSPWRRFFKVVKNKAIGKLANNGVLQPFRFLNTSSSTIFHNATAPRVVFRLQRSFTSPVWTKSTHKTVQQILKDLLQLNCFFFGVSTKEKTMLFYLWGELVILESKFPNEFSTWQSCTGVFVFFLFLDMGIFVSNHFVVCRKLQSHKIRNVSNI